MPDPASDRFISRSECDPLFAGSARTGGGADPEDDLEPVRERFAAASRPYLHSPWSWLAWAVLLPVAALITPEAVHRSGLAGALFIWSATILIGGAVEIGSILRAGRRTARTPLAAYVLRLQGNLSFVALALSVLCLWLDAAWALPGIWLLLLGHSFYMLGGLAFPPSAPAASSSRSAAWPRCGRRSHRCRSSPSRRQRGICGWLGGSGGPEAASGVLPKPLTP
jgi:hypothetical protein